MSKISTLTLKAIVDSHEARITTLESRVNTIEEQLKSKPTVSANGNSNKPTEKTVAFTKHDGTVIMVTQKQYDAWTKHRENFQNKEKNLATWEENRTNFKPSKELIEALKKNPTMTRKEAKTLGFVGTSDDLWNLKYGTDGVVKKGTYNR